MITTAFVKIWGETLGAIAWDAELKLGYFEYEPKFLAKEIDLAPLKMPISNGNSIFSFPELRTRSQDWDTFKGLPGLLADVLPDKYGNQMINAWLAQNGRPAGDMNPVELLCFIGTRGMGALEFEPTQLNTPENTFQLEINELVEISRKILNNRNAFETNLEEEETAIKQIISIGTSAGGARPKAVIAYHPKTKEVRSGQGKVPDGYEHWLIKLDGVSDEQLGSTMGYGRVEMAYYLMAIDCGIEMMPCQLLEENERAHFMTKRFDREKDNVKHHIQTLCAMQHFDFNEVTSFSYEQLFQTMRELKLDYQDAEQMFRRMVFNVLAKNCDDHTKNFSFILKQNQKWKLAPAYDICHAYRPDSIWVSQHALSVNGKRNDIDKSDLLTVAKSMNIKKGDAIINEINDLVRNWIHYADLAKVGTDKKHSIAKTLVHF